MSTDISQLPNEVSDKNNVVMSVKEKNVVVPNPPQQQPIQSAPPTQLTQDSIQQIVSGLQQAGGATSLHNRDIPANDMSHVTQDKQVQPNFIPEPQNTNYIEEESSMESLIQQNKNKQHEQDRLDVLYNELQTPLLVMILFFFFQLPYTQKFMLKYMPSLFNRDGNPSFSGYLIKTLFFGVAFYAITTLTRQLSQI